MTEINQGGQRHQLCMRYQEGKCSMENCRFKHFCAYSTLKGMPVVRIMGRFNMSPPLTDSQVSQQFHTWLDQILIVIVLHCQMGLVNRIHSIHLSFHHCLHPQGTLQMFQRCLHHSKTNHLKMNPLKILWFRMSPIRHPHQFNCLRAGVCMEPPAFFWTFVVGSNDHLVLKC